MCRATNVNMNNGSARTDNGADVKPKPKERKSVEDTVTSLRQELQVLYESLKDKNEELLCLEKEVRDRDVSVKYLKGEFKKLKECVAPTCLTCHKPIIKPSEAKGKGEERKTHEESQPDDIIVKLQKDLKDREGLIKELNKKIIRLSDNLIFVQKESLAKDDRLDDMQREIDKFRQVVMQTSASNSIPLCCNIHSNSQVRPFTKAMVEQRKNDDDYFHDQQPGVENTRVISSEPSRLKRTAISAEPLSQMQGAQNDLVKTPKTSV